MKGGLRGAIHGFSWLSAAEAIRVGISGIVTVYLARRLGATVFGYYSFALSVVGALLALVDGGLTSIGSREVAQRPDDVGGTVAAVVRLRLLLAVIATIALIAFVLKTTSVPLERRVVIVAGASLYTFVLTLDWVFYGLSRAPIVAVASLMRTTVFAVLTIAIAREAPQIWLVPAFQAAGELVAAAFLARTYVVSGFSRTESRRGTENHVERVRLKADTTYGSREARRTPHVARRTIEIALRAWPLGLGQIMRGLNFSFCVILVRLLMDDASAGRFAAALRLTQFAMGFAALYFVAYLPIVSRGLVSGGADVRRLTRQSLLLTAAATVPLAAVVTLFAHPIVAIVFGADYGPTAAPLQAMIWAVPAVAIGGHFRNALIAGDLVRRDLVWVTTSAAVNIVLSVALLGPLGLVGAAIAFTAAEVVLAIGTLVSVERSGVLHSSDS